MHLVNHHRDFYKVVKSVRYGEKVSKVTLAYVGRLSELEIKRLRILLRSAMESELPTLIKSFRNSKRTITSLLQQKPAPQVKLEAVRDNVYRKRIDLKWLKQVYINEGKSIGSIAQILGVSKDRVREHLDELGIGAHERMEMTRDRSKNAHIEFGWQLINGKKVKEPLEFSIIIDMVRWRNQDGFSFQKIAQKLTDMGIKGRLGATKWDRGAVRRMINRNLEHIN